MQILFNVYRPRATSTVYACFVMAARNFSTVLVMQWLGVGLVIERSLVHSPLRRYVN